MSDYEAVYTCYWCDDIHVGNPGGHEARNVSTNMSDMSDENFITCYWCDDIFISTFQLFEHVWKEHEGEAKDDSEKTSGPGVKRSRRSSKEEREHEVKKKKAKMAPASRAKRDQESSEEESSLQSLQSVIESAVKMSEAAVAAGKLALELVRARAERGRISCSKSNQISGE